MEKKHYHRWVYGIVIVAVVFTFLFTTHCKIKLN
jgi:hypothetical protein